MISFNRASFYVDQLFSTEGKEAFGTVGRSIRSGKYLVQ